MEAKVINAFTDRITNVVYLPGATYAGEATRVQELVDGGYLEQPKEKPKKAAPRKKKAE